MKSLAHKQTTTHPSCHDEDGACEGGRNGYPSDRQAALNKLHVGLSDNRDRAEETLGSETSGPVSGRTSLKNRFDLSASDGCGDVRPTPGRMSGREWSMYQLSPMHIVDWSKSHTALFSTRKSIPNTGSETCCDTNPVTCVLSASDVRWKGIKGGEQRGFDTRDPCLRVEEDATEEARKKEERNSEERSAKKKFSRSRGRKKNWRRGYRSCEWQIIQQQSTSWRLQEAVKVLRRRG